VGFLGLFRIISIDFKELPEVHYIVLYEETFRGIFSVVLRELLKVHLD
jgi:hypothetical protein